MSDASQNEDNMPEPPGAFLENAEGERVKNPHFREVDDYAHPMQQMLEHLINTAPLENKGAIECQISLKFANPALQGVAAGSLKRAHVKGVYELITIGGMSDERSTPRAMHNFIMPEDIFCISLLDKVEETQILTPKFGGKLPPNLKFPGR